MSELRQINFDGTLMWVTQKGMPQWGGFKSGNEFGHTWERFVSQAIRQDLKKDMSFLDAGANFGAYSILASHYTKSDIYAFEPVPFNIELLHKNTDHIPNIEVFPFALGDKEEVLKMEINPFNHGAHCLEGRKTNREEGTVEVDVDVTSIDALGLKPDFMKVDVEGNGMKFLEGAQSALETTQNILFELHRGEDKAPAFLKNLGFQIEQIQWGGGDKGFYAFR